MLSTLRDGRTSAAIAAAPTWVDARPDIRSRAGPQTKQDARRAQWAHRARARARTRMATRPPGTACGSNMKHWVHSTKQPDSPQRMRERMVVDAAIQDLSALSPDEQVVIAHRFAADSGHRRKLLLGGCIFLSAVVYFRQHGAVADDATGLQ